uniref:Major facilitator superfamily (MFS) profile domain-containing protein n=1 Tax=Anopheles gambiae TaxID=7165 RepID=A0A1S4H6N8_ANOGA
MAKEKEVGISARSTLWYLVFVGFAVNYMIRINTNITIVAMIKQSETEFVGEVKVDYACYVPIGNGSEALTTQTEGSSLLRSRESRVISPEQLLLTLFNLDPQKEGFDWNDYQQGLILGAFYWLHWITQIPGGILARRYGTKLVFGASNVIGCWMCFLMPIAAYWDYRVLVVLRVLQGLICGLAWPAMHHMAGQWIPPNERSKFVTAYLGSSVGVALNFPLFGFIISWTSWEYVYHFCGIFGTVWYVAWLYFVYDSPAEHPRIHANERKYIESSLGITAQSTARREQQQQEQGTPWRKIILSRAMWMTIIAQWGGIWGLFTLMTQAPTYFNNVHGWNIEMTGLLSGIPHLCRMLFAYVFSIVGDHLLKHELMSRTGVRKMGGTLCCVVNGIFVFILASSGCNSLMATIFLTLATTVHGAVSTGPLANLVDMSPRYAGILLGFSGMITVVPGFVSPIIVGMLGNHTVEQWRIIFLITSGTLIICGLLYMAFADSTLQPWNSCEDLSSVHDDELKGLKISPLNATFPEKQEADDQKEDDSVALRLSSV